MLTAGNYQNHYQMRKYPLNHSLVQQRSRCQPMLNQHLKKNPIPSIILHMGTNDLRSEDEPDKIANDIVDVAVACKQTGCEIIISALFPRGDKFSKRSK